MQTYKKLSKKTKKGQPVMKDRLEMLLEKIQQQVSQWYRGKMSYNFKNMKELGS